MAILLLKEEIVIYQLPDYKPMSTGLIVEVKEYKIQSTELEEVIATIVEMNEKEKDKPVEVYYTPKCKEIYFVKMIECQTANYNRVQQQIKIPSDTYQTARSCL